MKDSRPINTTPVFQKNLAAYNGGFSIICNEGGSRSGKTYSVIQLLCGIAQQKPGIRISIVSHSLPHIKRGAYRDFKVIMQDCGWWSEDLWRATDFYFTFPNGSYIELFGLEDEGKARGPGRDILFVNEANLVSKLVFDQLAMRTTGTIFMDWNPAEFNSWVYAIADNPKYKKIHSTYLHNIHNLSPIQVEYIESYKNLPDDFMWKVYGLGERGAAKELIYTKWQYCDELPGKGEIVYGIDFGFTAPCAMVKVEHYDGCNYVQEVLYQSGISKPELVTLIKSMGIKGRIYADAAEPDTIKELQLAGINVHAANKDVWNGIISVKSYPLFIHRQSKHLVEEIQSYKWATDSSGEITQDEKPVKLNDHLCDAMRYAIHTHLRKPNIKTWQI
jgi:phage terminase large subunit